MRSNFFFHQCSPASCLSSRSLLGSGMATRADGRLPNQLRAMAAEPGALSRADGSARFQHDGTQVLAAVWGPGEVRRARERPDQATLEVLVRPASGLAGPLEREMELLLTATLSHAVVLSLHPRTLVSLVVQVVDHDGSVLAAALHACGLALIHAGVPLRGMLGTCACAVAADGALMLDPTVAEEASAVAVATLGYLVCSADGDGGAAPACELLLSHSTGALSAEQHAAAAEAAREAAVAAAAFCRQSMTAGRAPLDAPHLALGSLGSAQR